MIFNMKKSTILAAVLAAAKFPSVAGIVGGNDADFLEFPYFGT